MEYSYIYTYRKNNVEFLKTIQHEISNQLV